MKTTGDLAKLSEGQLLQRFDDLVRADRHNTACLLAYIAEIDERKLWAKHACSSMFAYCMERFHMSESMTAKRIWAARTARRFPAILSMVARGELHLSGINQLGRHLTEENHRSILLRATHKSSREIDVLVAELAPRPDVPSRVRALPRRNAAGVLAQKSPRPGPRKACDPNLRDASESGAVEVRACAPTPVPSKLKTTVSDSATPSPVAPVAYNPVVALAPRRYKVEFTVDQNTHDRLRSLQDLLRHRFPSADAASIVSLAIETLLDHTLKNKAALTARDRPGGAPGRERTRAIPAAIRRAVWKRDAGRCAFVDEKRNRCRETSRIEFHHEIPYGRGGRHDEENISLRCRAHNQYQADLDFGREFMQSKRRDTGSHSARNV